MGGMGGMGGGMVSGGMAGMGGPGSGFGGMMGGGGYPGQAPDLGPHELAGQVRLYSVDPYAHIEVHDSLGRLYHFPDGKPAEGIEELKIPRWPVGSYTAVTYARVPKPLATPFEVRPEQQPNDVRVKTPEPRRSHLADVLFQAVGNVGKELIE